MIDFQRYQPAADLLSERVIVVTGAGDGLGRAAALAFARHGATVVLLGRTVAALERVYDAISDEGLPRAAIVGVDLERADAAACAHVAETLHAEFGRVDGVLHNAALLGALTPIEHYDAKLWESVLRVNVTAPFLLTQALLPLLRESRDPSVVFTSASVGRRARAFWGAYAVSCFAVEGLSALLADELENAGEVRVNTLDPGPVRTRMRARAFPGEDPSTAPAPDEVMGAYLYLIGPDSRGVTGQAFCAQGASAALSAPA
jgi:NAD(P)-dependent dehydrogenase (short-subunit alcohol dehydrogenase family)